MSDRSGIKISVKNLVDFVLRSGDLVSGFGGASRALGGISAHQRIQKSQKGQYESEVYLSYLFESPQIVLEINGRADGIITTRRGVIIDEIKTVTGDLEDITEDDNPLFWAQAKCYAFIYAEQNSLEKIGVQLTYCQVETHEVRRFRKLFSFSELDDFFRDIVGRYLRWAIQIQNWIEIRNESIRHLPFPFSGYRKGQRPLAVSVYRTISAGGGKKLFAQAPTGIGKTMATLFPAVKALGEGKIEKIFYLTAKTVTRELAENAVEKMRMQGLRLKTLTLTAKEKICFSNSAECRPDSCPFAKGHFDRVNGAIEEIFQNDGITRVLVEQYARTYQVCPFEFALDISLWVDCVVCDYNYVFDPKVYLRRFFAEQGGDYCFLVDEAHNLVDRAREMFSAELFKKPFLELRRNIRTQLPAVSKTLTKINAALLRAGKLCTDHSARLDDESHSAIVVRDLKPQLRKFMKAAEKWLVQNQASAFRDQLLDLYFQASDFARVAETCDQRYTTYVETIGTDVRIKLFCLDPSYLLAEALKRGQCAIFFSATLTPLEYFLKILGGEATDSMMKIPSPFPPDNLCMLLADQIRTTFRAREFSYDQIVESISAMVCRKTGNYLVYLPSYKYQHEIAQRFRRRNPDIDVVCQTSGMSEEAREEFLASFSADNPKTLVGFAVMGGVFGEGIDLVGDRLSGCAIVGVGLPQVGLERDIIRDYFEATLGLGFEYSYMYPGINKVLQAAGRVIRSESDRGVVLLIDERFSYSAYRVLLPEHWRPMRVKSPQQIIDAVDRFWRGNSSV